MKTHLITVIIVVLFITPASPAEMTGDELASMEKSRKAILNMYNS